MADCRVRVEMRLNECMIKKVATRSSFRRPSGFSDLRRLSLGAVPRTVLQILFHKGRLDGVGLESREVELSETGLAGAESESRLSSALSLGFLRPRLTLMRCTSTMTVRI